MSVVIRWALAAAISGAMGWFGYRRRSLDAGGAVAGVLVGLVTFGANYRMGVQLLLFFVLSSKLTRYGSDRKKKLEDGHKVGGQRTAAQALCNSGAAAACALAYIVLVGSDDVGIDGASNYAAAWLLCAVMCHYACSAGDTWSSELGILATQQPRMVIAPWRQVPTGTNGGVTALGLAASAAAGLVQGLAMLGMGSLFAAPVPAAQWKLLLLAVAASTGGSALDSLLGATLQASYLDPKTTKVLSSETLAATRPEERQRRLRHISGVDVLTNHQVNFVTNVVATLVGGFAGAAWIRS